MPIIPTVNNSGVKTLIFTPTDTANYLSAETTCTLTVNKSLPTITLTSSPIYYGQSLLSTNLETVAKNPYNGETVLGLVSWEQGLLDINKQDLTVDKSGSYGVVFTPTILDNYLVADSQHELTINKATPVLENAVSSTIVYEQSIYDAVVSGQASNGYEQTLNVAGSWSWDTDNINIADLSRPKVSESGKHRAVFSPVDSTNYTKAFVDVQLTVQRKQQDISFDMLSLNNASVKAESMATHLADYEINYDDKTITLTAYTTAIYPTAREIDFLLSDTNLATLENKVVEVVIIDGVSYSKTSITLRINSYGNYGVIELSANQFDQNTTPGMTNYAPHAEGNYANSLSLKQRLYIKRPHKALVFDDINLVYGDDTLMIEPLLNSGRTDFKLVSSNTDIVTINMSTMAYRILTIQNAGTATLTLSHDGYVNTNDISAAYVAFEHTITVSVAASSLNISLNNLTVAYGDTPNFSYTYTGFVYNEQASDVIVGLTSNYDASSMKDVKRQADGFGSYTVLPYGATNVSYPNYDITFTAGELTVQPRTITVNINDASKFYGEPTPIFDISYHGFVAGENQNMSGLVLPSVDYGNVEQFSSVGNYPILLTAGSANNYIFDTTDIAILTIERVRYLKMY